MTTLAIGCLLVPLCGPALAQTHTDHTGHDMDPGIQFHGILDQFEGRIGAGANAFRWEGHAWIGTDTDKLWLKSEGFALGKGGVEDGRLEVLYNRAISTWFDVQVGVRSDLDSGTGRQWAALGFAARDRAERLQQDRPEPACRVRSGVAGCRGCGYATRSAANSRPMSV